MSSPRLSLTADNEPLHANGSHEKETVTTDSPVELSEEYEHGKENGQMDSNASSVDEDGCASGHDDAHDGATGEHGDEDSDEDEDEEPALKYERIGGALPDLLKKDSASALAISNNLLVNNV